MTTLRDDERSRTRFAAHTAGRVVADVSWAEIERDIEHARDLRSAFMGACCRKLLVLLPNGSRKADVPSLSGSLLPLHP
jgi:hypothetical protein